MGVFVVTAPSVDLVALDVFKLHCRIATSDEDALLNKILAAITRTLDGPGSDSRFAFLPQRLEARESGFDAFRHGLPFPPLRDETTVEIKFFDPQNVLRTLDSATYFLACPAPTEAYLMPAQGSAFPVLASRPDAVRVAFDAGFDTLPANVHHAALLMAADLYANRETFVPEDGAKVPVTGAASKLLGPYWRPIVR